MRAIERASARNNPRLGLGGALLFDGETFLHLIEGPPETVRAMLARVRRDPRHHGIDGVVEQRIAAPAFPRWRARRLADGVRIGPAGTVAGLTDARRARLAQGLLAA